MTGIPRSAKRSTSVPTLVGDRIVFTLRVDRGGLQKILGLSEVQELPA